MRIRTSGSRIRLSGKISSGLPSVTAEPGIGQIFRVAGTSNESGSLTYVNLNNTLEETPFLNINSEPFYIVSLSGSLSDDIVTNFISGEVLLAVTNTFITASETGSLFTEELITTTGTGTWTKPSGVTEVIVECWGGGGAGGGATLADSAGGGGAGGQYARKLIIYSSSSQNISYNIGTGGTGGTGVGGSGNDTTWDTNVVVAKGGEGGQPDGQGQAASAPGGIGSTVDGVGMVVYKGGDGGTGIYTTSPNQAVAGSGGIGGASTGISDTINGGIELGGLIQIGAIITSGGQQGSTGNNYGGGGSGAVKISGPNRSGGAGAQGLIRLIYR